MQAIGKANIGKKRERNEDAIYVSNTALGTLPNLYIVADGMGGHRAGGTASHMAIQAFCEYIVNHDEAEIRTREDVVVLLKMAIKHANHVVYETSVNNENYSGMGTTLTAATIIGDIIYVAHVGDTRLYLVNETNIFQATKDHSLVQEMLEQGYISQTESKEHPQRHIITRAVGTYPQVKIDTLMYDMDKVDKVLLCSDGLTTMLTDEEIHQMLCKEKASVEELVDDLIDAANEKGGLDNIAVIIAKKYEVNKEC